MKSYDQAAKVAYENKSAYDLNDIFNETKDHILRSTIKEMISEIEKQN